MLVHPVVIPGSGTRSWTVLGDDDAPVVPVDRFLAYLTDIGRSPNTVKAYAHDMKDLWQFLGFRGLDWREARLEDIAEFVVWLQLPAAGRSGAVAVLPSSVPEVSVATVNRKLAAVSAFYAHQARNGTGPGDLLAAWRTGSRGGWKPFLHHVSKGRPYRGRAITLKAPSFFQLRNLREAHARGKPWHLIAHEDVLIFRAPGKPAGSGEPKDPQTEPAGPVPVAVPSGTQVRGEPARAA